MRKQYYIFDITKFILSFLVLGIHTKINEIGMIINELCNLSVPMFFVISGLLLDNNLKSPIWGGHKRTILRLFRLYVTWTIIYIPLSIYGYCFIEGHSINECLFITIRNFIVTGENWMSWPLWFLHSLIISMIILAYSYKKCWSKRKILVISVILLIIGKVISTILSNDTDGLYNPFVFYFKKIFVGVRPLLSFIWVGIGYCMNEITAYFGNNKIFVFVGMIVGLSLQFLGFEYGIYITVPSLFMILKGFQLDNLPNPLWFRRMSTIIYFGHMYVIFFVSHVLSKITIGTLSAYFIICCIVILMGTIILKISNFRKLRLIRFLYG